VNATAYYNAALDRGAQSIHNQLSHRSKDKCRIQKLRRQPVGIARPIDAYAQSKFLGSLITRASEGVDALTLVYGYLSNNMRRRAKSINTQVFDIFACQTISAIANQTGTQEWSNVYIAVRIRQMKTIGLVCHGIFGKSTIQGVSGEQGIIAQVFHPPPTITASAICIAQPGYTNSVSNS